MPKVTRTIEMDEASVATSCGNVFADIGVPNPEEALLKAEIVRQISKVIQNNGWTQIEAAEAMGVDQPKVSALLRGRLRDFSIDRLLRLVRRLGYDVRVVISPRTGALTPSTVALG